MRPARILAVAISFVSLVTPAATAAASPISVDATFVGTKGTMTCTATSCTMKEKSVLCQAVGLDNTMFVFASGCEATLEYTVPRTFIDPNRRLPVCVGTTVTGTFSLVMPATGTTIGPLAAHVSFTLTTAAFYTDPLIDLAGAAWAGFAEGDATSLCGNPETVDSTFRGRFSYAQVHVRTPGE